ncbi:MAG: transglutaminase TgpA family protein [Actinomycetota bacterium]
MGSEARARLGLFLLLVTTLFEFTGLFVPGNFLGPGLLAIVVAGGIAMGARRLGIGTMLTLLASAAGLVTYVTFVFANRFTAWGLPTPSAVGEVVAVVERALDKASIDFAPVPVRTGYVILMVIGLWLITTIGEIATFRWKRPMLASLPPIGMFAMLMVVGKAKGSSARAILFLIALLLYWGLESSHRLRSWGRWVPTWTGIDDDEEPASVTGAIARNMGLACIVVAMVAPLITPAIDEGLLSWRSGVGRSEGFGSGSGSGGRIDPFVSIASGLLEQSDSILFTVDSPDPSYWRLVTLPVFDSEGWRPTATEGDRVESEDVPEDLPPDAPLGNLQHMIAIAELEGASLPAAPTPSVVSLRDRQDDLRYRAASGDLLLFGDVEQDLEYTVTSRVPDFDYEDIVDAPVGTDDGSLTRLPEPLSPAVEALRDRWIDDAGTTYEELVAIQNRLTGPGFTYSTDPALEADRGDQVDYLERFLLDTRSGYCQQYASAFATLARSLGYETRIVVGFLPGAPRGDGGFAVRGTDAHAWPEVFFEGFGWVAFEPTPRVGEDNATASAPSYTSPPGEPISTDPGRNPEEFPGNANADDAAENRPERLDRGDGGSSGPSAEPEWQRTFARLVTSLGVLLILFLAAVPALKAWRIRRLYARAHTSRARAAAAFEEFLIEAAELSSPRGAAETAPAYVRRLMGSRPLPLASASELAAIYDACQYAPTDPPDGVAARARTLAADLKSTLWVNASLWSKGMRLFAPRFGGRVSLAALRR